MKYELTTDKKALLIITDHGLIQSVATAQIPISIASLKKQKQAQIDRYDTEIKKLQDYQTNIDLLSKKKE